MKRVLEFIRSVVPADPFQLLFLAGSVLLFICMQPRCFPVAPHHEPTVKDFLGGSYEDPLTNVRQSWLFFSFLARLPVFFAGAAGLFVCFWPGKHTLRRILILVCLPAVGGLTALCVRFLQVSQDLTFPVVSVLQRAQHNQAGFVQTLWSMGPALHIAFLGASLVLVFVSRLAMGIGSLPMSLQESGGTILPQEDGWNRIQAFVWVGIVAISMFILIAWNSVPAINRMLLIFIDFHSLPDGLLLSSALGTAMLAGVAAWAVGKSRWKELRQFTRLPEVQFGMLGAVIPIAINSASNIVVCLRDQIHFGKFGAPPFSSYFQFPQAPFFWYLPGAAFEEVIWRGYLQPRFVRRFGIIRGIFLLGLAWSAFHFLGDFRGTSDDYRVFGRLGFRLFSCLVLGYVFGWLALRSGSVWPSALAHGFHNVWAVSGAGWVGDQNLVFLETIPWVCWVVLAVLLFRFWPPAVPDELPVDCGPTPTEPPPLPETLS